MARKKTTKTKVKKTYGTTWSKVKKKGQSVSRLLEKLLYSQRMRNQVLLCGIQWYAVLYGASSTYVNKLTKGVTMLTCTYILDAKALYWAGLAAAPDNHALWWYWFNCTGMVQALVS